MDDPRILRIITVGLILAALAVVYFLFTGGFAINKPKVSQNQTAKVSPSPTPATTATPNPNATPSVVSQTQPTPAPSAAASAYNTLASRNQGNVQTLPRTGFPAGLMFIFSASAIAAGFGLRKFPC